MKWGKGLKSEPEKAIGWEDDGLRKAQLAQFNPRWGYQAFIDLGGQNQ